MEGKRNVPSFWRKVLDFDAKLSEKFVTKLQQYDTMKTFETQYCKLLELSCNGIVWLALTIGSTWLLNAKHLYEMQMNFLIGLIVDILAIVLTKSFFRRRRPTACNDMLQLGPDKFSFPSGHASRASFVALFFTFLYPLPMLICLFIFIWALAVCLSRVVLKRHYILDVCCGIILGGIELLFIQLIWINEKSASNLINFISDDSMPEMEI